MKLFRNKPKIFDTLNKSKIQIIVDEIDRIDDAGYNISSGNYSSIHDKIEGGYSFSIWAYASSIWKNENKMELGELRISVNIDSAKSRRNLERGVIGGAVYDSDKYVEVVLSIKPRFARDILYELRRSPKRGMRIDGYSISEKVFRVVYFSLYPAAN